VGPGWVQRHPPAVVHHTRKRTKPLLFLKLSVESFSVWFPF
jgi:hypothetical protein